MKNTCKCDMNTIGRLPERRTPSCWLPMITDSIMILPMKSNDIQNTRYTELQKYTEKVKTSENGDKQAPLYLLTASVSSDLKALYKSVIIIILHMVKMVKRCVGEPRRQAMANRLQTHRVRGTFKH